MYAVFHTEFGEQEVPSDSEGQALVINTPPKIEGNTEDQITKHVDESQISNLKGMHVEYPFCLLMTGL